MKLVNLSFVLLFLCVSFIGTSMSYQPINAIIGDKSLDVLGIDASTLSEQERITIHLSYVEQVLRSAKVNRLTRKQRKNRLKALDLLHKYWTQGNFPVNLQYPNKRKPCFRDNNNTLCAVGYLVNETGKEILVDEIEKNMNYALIEEMDSDALINWAEENGLTLKECAMIQPTYGGGWGYYSGTISFGNAFASSSLSGINASSMIVGAMHLNNNRTGIALPIIGIGTGIGQATLGAFNMRNYQYNSINHKRLAMINVGLGTLTTLFNTYVLVNSIKNRKPNSDLTWNVYGHQNPFNNQFAMGISINKQF